MVVGSPWAWHAHLGGWAVLVVLSGGYVLALRKLGRTRPRASRAEVWRFGGGVACLALVVIWPVADLARHWLLLAHLVQQVMLLLVVPPLLLLGLPRWLITRATRLAVLDTLLGRLSNPVIASLVFTAAAVGALLPPVVDAEAASGWVTGGVLLGLVIAGTVMWLPVLRVVPGQPHLSTLGRSLYLFAQSLLPNFPALILIFARHSLYPAFARTTALGLSGLADQQLAGVAAKILGISILWGVAGAILVRAQAAQEAGVDPDPLTWEDVEVELRRLERRPRPTDAS